MLPSFISFNRPEKCATTRWRLTDDGFEIISVKMASRNKFHYVEDVGYLQLSPRKRNPGWISSEIGGTEETSWMENKKRRERRNSSQNNGGKFSAWRQINGLYRTVVGGDTGWQRNWCSVHLSVGTGEPKKGRAFLFISLWRRNGSEFI